MDVSHQSVNEVLTRVSPLKSPGCEGQLRHRPAEFMSTKCRINQIIWLTGRQRTYFRTPRRGPGQGACASQAYDQVAIPIEFWPRSSIDGTGRTTPYKLRHNAVSSLDHDSILRPKKFVVEILGAIVIVWGLCLRSYIMFSTPLVVS